MSLTIIGAYFLFKIADFVPIIFTRFFPEKITEVRSVVESKIRGSIAIGFAIFLLQVNMQKRILYLFGRLIEEEKKEL